LFHRIKQTNALPAAYRLMPVVRQGEVAVLVNVPR
jgi:hypothetical protein